MASIPMRYRLATTSTRMVALGRRRASAKVTGSEAPSIHRTEARFGQ